MPAPRITVAIPTCNRPELLARAIRSVLASTLQDFEICISDDGDPKLGDAWIGRFADPRIRYRPHQRCGVEQNWSAACEMGSAPLVVKLDDDDEIAPGFLESTVSFLDAHTGVSVVYAAHEGVFPDGRAVPLIDKGFWRDRSLADGCDYSRALLLNEGYPLNHKSAGVFRRALAAEIGWFRVAQLDVTFSISIALGHQVGYVPRVLYRYHLHGGTSEGMGIPTYDRLLQQFGEFFDWEFVRRHHAIARLEPVARARLNFIVPMMYLAHSTQIDPLRVLFEKIRVTRRRIPGARMGLMIPILACLALTPRWLYGKLFAFYTRSRVAKAAVNFLISPRRARMPDHSGGGFLS